METYRTKIPDWPQDERPRERMLHNGPEALSEAELLAIILRTGNGKVTSVDMARSLLKEFGGIRGLDAVSIQQLQTVKGIGLAKACQIKSALELSKRLVKQKWRVNEHISCSDDVYQLVHLRMRDLGREVFKVLYLSARNQVLKEKTLFEGSLCESVVSPREIILEAVQAAAANIILLHNHPSGNPSPSHEDRNVTDKICAACKYFDVNVLDHIIIGKDSYYSFADQGLLTSGNA